MVFYHNRHGMSTYIVGATPKISTLAATPDSALFLAPMSAKPGRKLANDPYSPERVGDWITRLPPDPKITEQDVAAAMRAAFGNLKRAAELLNCTRDNVYKWIRRTPALQQLQSELLEEEKDEHEWQLRDLGMNNGNITAILAFLNAKAGDRGYGRSSHDREHLERQAAQIATQTHQHLHLHFHSERLARVDDSELDQMIAAHRAALAAPIEETADETATQDPPATPED